MSGSSTGNRVLVLAYHEPTIDTRVHYTAQSLANKHLVTVLALVDEAETRPAENEPQDAAYRTIRLPFKGRGWPRVPRAYLEIWLRLRLGETRLAGRVIPPLAFHIPMQFQQSFFAIRKWRKKARLKRVNGKAKRKT